MPINVLPYASSRSDSDLRRKTDKFVSVPLTLNHGGNPNLWGLAIMIIITNPHSAFDSREQIMGALVPILELEAPATPAQRKQERRADIAGRRVQAHGGLENPLSVYACDPIGQKSYHDPASSVFSSAKER